MKFKRLFLPIGLVVVIALGLAFPAPGRFMKPFNLTAVMVILTFAINGYQARFSELGMDWRIARAGVFIVLSSLVLGPFLGLWLSEALGLSGILAAGLIITCAMPCTLASATVVTEISGGNIIWALFMTVGLNLCGIFIAPFTIKACLTVDDVSISAGMLLGKLLLLVLVPFVIGVVARRVIRKSLHGAIAFSPTIFILYMVWVAVAYSAMSLRALPLSRFALVASGCLAAHSLLLVVNTLGGYALWLRAPERKALIFTGSQKTLPLSISVIAALGERFEEAMIVCVIFHFGQVMLDSLLASRCRETGLTSTVTIAKPVAAKVAGGAS